MNAEEAFNLSLDRLERAFRGMHNRDQEIAQLRRDVHALREVEGPKAFRDPDKVRYARAHVPFTNEMVLDLPIPLTSAGDTILVWANEGDLLRAGIEVKK